MAIGGPGEYPELWAFLESLTPGQILDGSVAAIESFGVFVALDDGPAHPLFPGVGFVSGAEVSWRHVERCADVVSIGQRVSGEVLQFDTWNLEARLSLKALQPNPFLSFTAGQRLHGRVDRVVPFGVFVGVADGVSGLVRNAPAAWRPGDEVEVIVTEVSVARMSLDAQA